MIPPTTATEITPLAHEGRLEKLSFAKLLFAINNYFNTLNCNVLHYVCVCLGLINRELLFVKLTKIITKCIFLHFFYYVLVLSLY